MKNLSAWVNVVVHTAICGAATAVVARFADPGEFQFNMAHLKHMEEIAVWGALIGVLSLYRKSPLNQSQPPAPQPPPKS